MMTALDAPSLDPAAERQVACSPASRLTTAEPLLPVSRGTRSTQANIGNGSFAGQRTVTPPPTVPDGTQRTTTRPDPMLRGSALRDARNVCCTAVAAAYEVLQGHRPLHQLTSLLTADVYDALEQRLLLVADGHPLIREVAKHRVRLRRVRCSPVNEATVEAALAVDVGERTRAAAVRAEIQRSRWRVTVMLLG